MTARTITKVVHALDNVVAETSSESLTTVRASAGGLVQVAITDAATPSVEVTTLTPGSAGGGGDGTNEVQHVKVNASSGTTVLTIAGHATSAIAFDADAATVQVAADIALGLGNVDVSGDALNASGLDFEFTGVYAATNVAQITATDGDLNVDSPGVDVMTYLPGGTGQNEQQLLWFSNVGGGLLFLEYDGETTAGISYTDNSAALAASIQSALEDLPNIEAGNVEVSYNGGEFAIDFVGTLAETNVPQIVPDGSELEAAEAVSITTTQAGVPGEGGSPTNEVQLIEVEDAAGGTFDIEGETVDFDASLADVQAALDEALGDGNTLVTGTVGAYHVEFIGTLAASNQPLLTADDTDLVGGIGDGAGVATVELQARLSVDAPWIVLHEFEASGSLVIREGEVWPHLRLVVTDYTSGSVNAWVAAIGA